MLTSKIPTGTVIQSGPVIAWSRPVIAILVGIGGELLPPFPGISGLGSPLLVVFLFILLLHQDLPAPFAGGLALGGSLLTRSFLSMQGLGLFPGWGMYYLLAGLLFEGLKPLRWSSRPLALVGVLAIVELGASLGSGFTGLLWFHGEILPALVVGSVTRTLIVTGLYYIARSWEIERRDLQTQRLNEQLWLFVIHLETGIFFLKKSANEVERVMSKSFALYERLRGRVEGADTALEVARDVHELKADYQRIIAALDRIAQHREAVPALLFSEIVDLVMAGNKEYAKQLGKDISFIQEINHHFKTADYSSWVSVLNNLVANAVEALDRHGIVQVVATLYPSRFVLTVADDGPGIPPDHWNLVFHPGYSTKESQKTGAFSTGLGLTHTRSLVEAMGGSIRIDSSSEKGTVFLLQFPPHVVQEGELNNHD